MPFSSRTVAVCAALLIVVTAEYHAQPDRGTAIASRTEIVVFGATPAGVTAAVSAAVYRNYASCTTSSASITLPTMR